MSTRSRRERKIFSCAQRSPGPLQPLRPEKQETNACWTLSQVIHAGVAAAECANEGVTAQRRSRLQSFKFAATLTRARLPWGTPLPDDIDVWPAAVRKSRLPYTFEKGVRGEVGPASLFPRMNFASGSRRVTLQAAAADQTRALPLAPSLLPFLLCLHWRFVCYETAGGGFS